MCSLCVILLFSYHDLCCTFHHACPLLCSFSSFCSCPTAFHSFCFDAHFWSCFFCVFLACLLLFFFFFSLPCSFSLLSSACLPPLALTGGYSSLGWAETASLYNTDRLLCNQIPSVATSEDSLSCFLHHTHTRTHVGTHMHIHTPHLCLPLLNSVCVRFSCTMTRVLTIITPDSFLARREEVTGVTFTTSCFFHLSRWGFKGHCLQVYPCLLCGSVCQQDLGCCIRQEIVDFSSSVLDQRPTISKAASLSQCLSNICPCSGTENVDTVPKVPLQVPPPFVVACYHTLRFKNIFHLVLRVCFSFSAETVFFKLSHYTFSGKCVSQHGVSGGFTARQPNSWTEHILVNIWYNSPCWGTFVTKKHKDSGPHFDFSSVRSSYQRPKWAVHRLNHFDTYSCKMTVGLKLKKQNTIEVFLHQRTFVYRGRQSVCLCASPFICLTVRLFHHCAWN